MLKIYIFETAFLLPNLLHIKQKPLHFYIK
jgi:hypothetical protein